MSDLVDATPAYDQPYMTPIQALYHLLVQTGYCNGKQEFARLIRIGGNNVYAYLADPGPREDNDEDARKGRNRSRICPRPETIQGWCWGLRTVTGLAIDVVLKFDGSLELHARGTDSKSKAIKPIRYRTVYRDYDFVEPIAWLTEETALSMEADLIRERNDAIEAETAATGHRSKAAIARERKKIDKQLGRVRERLSEIRRPEQSAAS
jgi:hypothetical protein